MGDGPTAPAKDGPFPFEYLQAYSQAVYSVEHIEITFIALNGPRIALITAYGTTVTPGWSEPRLQPYRYFIPPKDGIWDFIFVAKPPSMPVPEVLSHIATAYVWTLGQGDFQGVRVHAATNTLEKKIDGMKEVKLRDMRNEIGKKVA